MSDDPAQIPQEDIDWAIANDDRVRAVVAMLDLKTALAPDTPLWLVMGKLRADAEKAFAEFATINLGDLGGMQELQSRVFRYQVASETFAAVIGRGEAADQAIRAEAPATQHEDGV